MSCEPTCPCGCGAPVLALDPPPPGETHLRRRLGEYHGFVRDLVETAERQVVDGGRLGSRWDLDGDPAAERLVELWAYVAEGVAAYTELTAGESYLPTAQDWTDLRRIAALVGFKPRPPIATQGWVVAELDKGAEPLVPERTRVQAPAKPGRAVQTYEVVADTQLHAKWAGLTATWVPQPEVPKDRTLRFLGDPVFKAADRILFVLEEQTGVPTLPAGGWFAYWGFVLQLVIFAYVFTAPAKARALGLATVGGASSELGTTVVKFDRDLDKLLSTTTDPYAAYRVAATAAVARTVKTLPYIDASGTFKSATVSPAPGNAIPDQKTVTLDRPLEDLSAHRLVAVVDWTVGACDVVEIDTHSFVEWQVAPGTTARVSQLTFTEDVPTLKSKNALTVYVVDRRVVAQNYVLPPTEPAKAPSDPTQVRLFPPPSPTPERIAIGVENALGDVDWQVFGCSTSNDQELTQDDPPVPSGLIVDLDGTPRALPGEARASANLLRVQHGKTTSATLGSGDATQAGQEFTTADAPIAYDLDDSGTPVPSMVLRVEGVRWDEVPSLYGAGDAEVFAVRRAPDGSETLRFGDGTQGSRLPTGRGNVAATYRVGGGRAGEVASGEIDTLLGSVRGVKKVRGADPTEGGSDEDSESKLRRLAPTRARAFGRAVSAEDLLDLALGYPGVTHAAVWDGPGPTGGSGLHLGFIHEGNAGPRPPLSPEIAQLASYLDARRDATVPLTVVAGTVCEPQLTVTLAADPRRVTGDVAAAVAAALADETGPLGAEQRTLGQPLDRSDVFAVIQGVTGVVGVSSLDLPGADAELGRRGAHTWELLVPSADPVVTGAPA